MPEMYWVQELADELAFDRFEKDYIDLTFEEEDSLLRELYLYLQEIMVVDAYGELQHPCFDDC